MTNADLDDLRMASASTHGRSATPDVDPGRRAAGLVLMLTSSVSNQTGAAVGALAMPTIGPVGVVAVRQLVTACVLTPIVRPTVRGLTRSQWWPILGLAMVFSVMNLSLYAAIDRIGLGMAVTLEFLGPLAVAICSSRRARDIAAALAAEVGVVVLTHPGLDTDLFGVGLALVAAVSWASYILLNRSVGARVPGLHGTTLASLVTAAVWTPVAAYWFTAHLPSVTTLAYAAVCGLLASVVPYATDLLALRRVPAHLFGTFASMNPVLAAMAGVTMLGQHLTVAEWVGIALIVVSNVVVTAHGFSRPRGSRKTKP